MQRVQVSADQDVLPPPPQPNVGLLSCSAATEQGLLFRQAVLRAAPHQTEPQSTEGPLAAWVSLRRQVHRRRQESAQRAEEQPAEPAEHAVPSEHGGAPHEHLPTRVGHVRTDGAHPEQLDQLHDLLD